MIFGLFITMFIPGYAITLVLYPEKKAISYVKRIVFSVVLSMISVILLVLFIDEILAVNTTPVNIAATIILFSVFAVCIWLAELYLMEKIPNFRMKINDINGYHFPFHLSLLERNGLLKNLHGVKKKVEQEDNYDDL